MYSSEIKSNDKSKLIKQLELGDAVLAFNYGNGPKWRRGIIVGKLGINVYNVFVKEVGLVWKRHLSQLLSIPPDYNNTNQSELRNSDDDDVNFSTVPTSEDVPDPAIEYDDQSSEIDPNNDDLRRSSRVRRPPLRYGFEE